ncbi:MAG: lecithin retinol acyltransferase family protein [Pirellula sp.]
MTQSQPTAKVSDLIFVTCARGLVPYLHYGIYLGDETVVHLATESDSARMSVQRISIEQFANGSVVCIEVVDNPLPDQEVVERALSSVGRNGYHLVAGNCEHFARELKTGVAESHQVDTIIKSILRTAFAGMASTMARGIVARSIANAPRARFLMTAGALVPTAIAETVRCASYITARKCNLAHEHAERSSRSIGYAASAVGGFVVGGPVGSVAALAISVASDRVTDTIHRRLNDQNLNSSSVSS